MSSLIKARIKQLTESALYERKLNVFRRLLSIPGISLEEFKSIDLMIFSEDEADLVVAEELINQMYNDIEKRTVKRSSGNNTARP